MDGSLEFKNLFTQHEKLFFRFISSVFQTGKARKRVHQHSLVHCQRKCNKRSPSLFLVNRKIHETHLHFFIVRAKLWTILLQTRRCRPVK